MPPELAALSTPDAVRGVLLVSNPSDIFGSVVDDTVVQRNCSLHVRGSVRGSLTIEQGAKVIVEGSVDGKIVNRGGTLVINNKGLAACVTLDGPPEAEACGVLKINLSALAWNWETLVKRTDAECAAVLKANAYGCGIDPIAGALANTGCKTFFVSNLPEAKRVRAAAPAATIYVLNGFYSGTGSAFAQINARPVINGMIQLAEWDAFVATSQWAGGCAINVDTAGGKDGFSIEDAALIVPRFQTDTHGVALLMSRLAPADRADRRQTDRQIEAFRDLRRLYGNVPASLAGSSDIIANPKIHFDLVRVGGPLYGINPTPGAANPMQQVLELRARIVQVRDLSPGETIAEGGAPVRRRTRIAWISVGHADGYPRPAIASNKGLQVIVGGMRCPVAGPPSMDLLPVDVTDLPNPTFGRFGQMVTLLGSEIVIDDVAAAAKATGPELLSRLGHRFHRIYYAN